MTARRSNVILTAVAFAVATGVLCAIGCGLLVGGMGWLR